MRRLPTRIALVVCLLLALVLCLTGTGTALTLTIVTHEAGPTGDAIALFNEEMKKQGRDLRVEVVEGDVEKSLVMLAGGVPPDIIEIDLVHGPVLMAAGTLRSLDDFIARDDFEDFVGGFMPGMLRMGQYQGKTYMFPFWGDNSALYYSITRLEEAGLPDKGPRTWDELIEISKKTTNPQQGYYAFRYMPPWGGGSFWFQWLPFLWGNDGRFLNDAGTKCVINSEPALQALKLWHDLRNVYQVTRPTDDGTYFNDGKDTFRIQGADSRPTNPNLKWDVVPIPTRLRSQSPSSFIGGGTIGITADSKHADEAWEVIKFLVSEKVQEEVIAKKWGTLIHQAALDNPYFEEDPPLRVFAEAAFYPNARCVYSLAGFRELKVVVDDFYAAVVGEMPLEEALMRMEQEVNAILSRLED